MRDECKRLGAEISDGPSQFHYFTASFRMSWPMDGRWAEITELQSKIQAAARNYPDVVCYSYDPSCTLLYIL